MTRTLRFLPKTPDMLDALIEALKSLTVTPADSPDGWSEGSPEGWSEGSPEGWSEGSPEGLAEGLPDSPRLQ